MAGALMLCLFHSSGLMAPREVLTGNGEWGQGGCTFPTLIQLSATESPVRSPPLLSPSSFPGHPPCFLEQLVAEQANAGSPASLLSSWALPGKGFGASGCPLCWRLWSQLSLRQRESCSFGFNRPATFQKTVLKACLLFAVKDSRSPWKVIRNLWVASAFPPPLSFLIPLS